jgi:quinol monooxygenase YgiN
VLSVTRHRVPPPQEQAFLADARSALDALRARPGFLGGTAGRSTDDAELWVLVTEWTDVGSLRRALSSFDVKVSAVPLLATTVDEANVFESLLVASPQGVDERGSDRAHDADGAGPGRG